MTTTINKKIMTLVLALVAASYVSPETPIAPQHPESAFFKATRHPDSPNLLQQALVFFTGTQQNHWTIENMLPYYGTYCVPIPLAHPYIQRAACGSDGEKVFKNGTKDLFLRYVPILNSMVQFFYMPSATSKVLKDIETECRQLGIQSEISRGSVPDNENYLLLLRPANYRLPGTFKIIGAFAAYLALRKIRVTRVNLNLPSIHPRTYANSKELLKLVESLRKHFESSSEITFKSFDEMDACVAGGAFALFLISRYCFYFNRYIIPYSTIEKLSPELQERCYNLMWYHK